MKTFVVNPGSTSTKLAVYEDLNELGRWSISHPREELCRFDRIADQLDYRYALVLSTLKSAGYGAEDFDCVVSRGGTPPYIRSGATRLGPELLEVIRTRPKQEHASNLGPMIAERIVGISGAPAFIYDPITTDEINELARFSGIKDVHRESMCHVLNTKAMAIETAIDMNRNWHEMSIIVIHIGGGNSVCLWKDGRLYDTIPADEGTFSAERCGGIRCEALIDLIEKRGVDTVKGYLTGKGGAVSHLGTNDLRVVRDMVEANDSEAVRFCEAMAYGIAKNIGSLAPVVHGKVDAITFTGGGAYWGSLVGQITRRIEYLGAPVFIKGGENEMKSLATGAYRVMNGEERVWNYGEESEVGYD